MVLVDTSVWLRALYGQSPYQQQLDALLEASSVVGHELIYGELLIGDKGGRDKFLQSYARMLQLPQVPHSEVVALVRKHQLHGRGAGWIDIHLLASALASKVPLWTADPRLELIARDFKIAYQP